MQQYEMFELTLSGPPCTGNQAQVDVTATFSWNQAGEKKMQCVSGFYDGTTEKTQPGTETGIYKVRFLPMQPGSYHYLVKGAVQAEGTVQCSPAQGKEKGHGPVRAVETHFVYTDGSPYYPFGTTVYALAHQEDALVEQTIDTLANAPFNKIRMCVFPKHYDFNYNEPPFYAFQRKAGCGEIPVTQMMERDLWDVTRPDVRFWHRMEEILEKIFALGIEVDLILFHPYDRWGFSQLTMQENEIYLDYLLRRLSAYPQIWWSMANEYDLMGARKAEDWKILEDWITEHDPVHHLLSNHNCFRFYDFTHEKITHCCLQTKLVSMADQFVNRYHKPVIYDEMCYEGNLTQNWGNLSAFELVNRFWCVCAKGCYGTHGETFSSEDDILWWARGGTLKGESSARIGFLKDILYSLPEPLTPDTPRMTMLQENIQGHSLSPETAGQFPKRAETFLSAFAAMDEADRMLLAMTEPEFSGHAGEKAYLHYYARTCPVKVQLALPIGKSYQIELLDAWNMTEVVLPGKAVAQAAETTGFQPDLAAQGLGLVDVYLPGREAMAVLAREA